MSPTTTQAKRPHHNPGNPAAMINPHPGHCRVCDGPVSGAKQYCDEHRPPPREPGHRRRPDGPEAEPVTSSAGPASPSARDVVHALPPPPKRVTQDATAKFFATILFYLALFIVMGFVDRAVPDEPEERKEAHVADLQLSKEDATKLARPLARLITPIGVWQRVGPALVGNTDAIDALVVMYDWLSALVRFRRRAGRHEAPTAPLVEPAMNGAGWHASPNWGTMPSQSDIERIRKEREHGAN
jgi:hypothetical protein